jgi:hypothetical protein
VQFWITQQKQKTPQKPENTKTTKTQKTPHNKKKQTRALSPESNTMNTAVVGREKMGTCS